MDNEANFMNLLLWGDATYEQFDDYVGDWHESDEDCKLHEYLGMTIEEYSIIAISPNKLPDIVLARKIGQPLETWEMSEEGWEDFIKQLQQPPREPTEKMKRAVERYKSLDDKPKGKAIGMKTIVKNQLREDVYDNGEEHY